MFVWLPTIRFIKGNEMRFLFAISICCAALWNNFVAAQTQFPTKQIKLISPFPAGGLNDWITRFVAKGLGESFQQPVLVENRPGGGTIPASEYVARSAPDGYTLLLSSNTALAIAPGLYPKLPYNVATDFSLISVVANGPYLVLVNPELPVKTMRELIAYAKVNPGKLSYGSTGNGTPSHLGGELMKAMAGIYMVHIPYKGSAPALTDLVGGQIHLTLDPIGSSEPLIKAGKLRALAITSATRSPLMPDLPTVAESGLAGYEVNVLYGVIGPAGIPKDIVARLNTEIGKHLRTPEAMGNLRERGVEPAPSSPESFAATIRAETQQWARVIKTSGARLD